MAKTRYSRASCAPQAATSIGLNKSYSVQVSHSRILGQRVLELLRGTTKSLPSQATGIKQMSPMVLLLLSMAKVISRLKTTERLALTSKRAITQVTSVRDPKQTRCAKALAKRKEDARAGPGVTPSLRLPPKGIG